MSNEELAVLATKVVEGKATIDELHQYNLACDSFQNEQQSWRDMEADLSRMQSVSLEKFWQSRAAQVQKKKLSIVRFSQIAAAAVLIVIGLWVILFRQAGPGGEQGHVKMFAKTQDVAPGGNKAMLTLSNGNTIRLSEQKKALVIDASSLKYSDGEEINIANGNDSGVMRITTPRGGQYKVILPDSSEVWLNAASSLVFPSSFAGLNQRKVTLTGEAYFEIFKNKKQAFIVTTENQVVEVFGTHFNVSAYAGEHQKTTLLEGSVRVNKNLLVPGQEANVEANGSVHVKNVEASEAVAWKNGKFSFEREEIGSIMKKIERWYDVEVSYEDDVRSVRLTGSVSRFENVSKLLAMLQNTREVRFKIEGKKIIVSK